MTARHPRYGKEEHARRGTDIDERQVRAQVEAGNQGKIVALDVDSGDIEVADTTLAAGERLLTRCPTEGHRAARLLSGCFGRSAQRAKCSAVQTARNNGNFFSPAQITAIQ